MHGYINVDDAKAVGDCPINVWHDAIGLDIFLAYVLLSIRIGSNIQPMRCVTQFCYRLGPVLPKAQA